MLLMAAEGLIGPRPDVAIFADTGDEPQEVYDHLKKVQAMGYTVHEDHLHAPGVSTCPKAGDGPVM